MHPQHSLYKSFSELLSEKDADYDINCMIFSIFHTVRHEWLELTWDHIFCVSSYKFCISLNQIGIRKSLLHGIGFSVTVKPNIREILLQNSA